MQLAVALYNNDIDDADELEFRKGDVLTVLIENPHGLDGWWLCQHQGKYGLCPGNRLKLVKDPTPTSIRSTNLARLSTVSMYDGLLTDRPATSPSHDFDKTQRSDFISDSATSHVFDSSPESSSRSSGIYSTVDPHHSSSSSDFYVSNINTNHQPIDIKQLEISFGQLNIRSTLPDAYRQLLAKPTIQPFIDQCRLFLREYGYLLDRYSYKMIKENLLDELESSAAHVKRISRLATKILHLVQCAIDLRLKEVPPKETSSFMQKAPLESIAELPNEKSNSSSSSATTTKISSHSRHKSYRSHMTTSKTCHSNLSLAAASNTTHESSRHSMKPLVQCYYRHILAHIDVILKRFSSLGKNSQKIPSLIVEGKALIVAGQKLVFILETLHEHLRQTQTPLLLLTRQLDEALIVFLQFIKQLSQPTTTTTTNQQIIVRFKQNTITILSLVKRIKLQCSTI